MISCGYLGTFVVLKMAAYTDLHSKYDFRDEYEYQEQPSVSNASPRAFLVYPVNDKLHVPSQRKLEFDEVEKIDGSQKYFNLSIRLASAFCENVLAHPFTVLKHQCQVHQNSRRYHLLPFTIIPIVIKIQGRQGLGTLWKGIGSVFIVKGLIIVCGDIISKLTQWPKSIRRHDSIKKICQHLFLKFISVAVVTPFYSACLIETVQSDIASEKPGIHDCIIEGIKRIVPRKHTPTSRILPVWKLAFPTAIHGVLHYVISSAVQQLTLSLWKYKAQKNINKVQSKSDDSTENGYMELTSSFIGHMVSDILLYPMETVLNRLHIQGTRTIIDNLDTGYEVTPVITKYEGPLDCMQTIVDEEGASGLFKGFGALILQFALHAAVLGLTRFIFIELRSHRRPVKRGSLPK